MWRVKTMVEEMFGRNAVMIFAGNPAQMNDFMKLSPGFKSRIRSIFHIPGYT